MKPAVYKAYVNDRPIIFHDVYEGVNSGSGLFVMSESQFSLDDVVQRLQTDSISGILFLSDSPRIAWQQFVSRFKLMEAAGGLVLNDAHEILVIYRRNHWDLPKGKLDYGESPEAAAIREVEEECGIGKLKILQKLTQTFHTYTEKNKDVLKKTHWYLMTTSDKSDLVPQVEEDIEDVKWMKREKIESKVYSKTYASIRDVFEVFFDLELNGQHLRERNG